MWLTLFVPHILSGQLLYSLADAPTLGRGGAGIAATGLPALWLNPAGIATGERLGYGATVMQRYGLRELTTVGGGVVYRGFGLQVSTFGYGTYRASRFGVVYARSLSERWRVGAELSLLRQLAIGYTAATRLLPAVGVQYAIHQKVVVGLTVKDPTGSAGQGARLGAGLAYRLGDHLRLLADAEAHWRSRLLFRFGVGYSPVPAVRLQLGYASDPGTISVGATFRLAGDVLIAVAGAQHQQLGHVAGAGLYRPADSAEW